jgi:kynurenine formamidase
MENNMGNNFDNDVEFVDLSQTIRDGEVTYQGLPAPLICDFIGREKSRDHYADGTTFQIDKIEMVGNSGTYLDSPFHRFEDGIDISELPLERIANLEFVVVRCVSDGLDHAVGAEAISRLDVAGKAVLFETGWSRHWATDQYHQGHSFLSAELAAALLDGGAALAGIDSLNIDDTRTGERPVHSTLLRHGIPIIEHMTNLSSCPDRGGRFLAVPPKMKRVGTFPVRAFVLHHI